MAGVIPPIRPNLLGHDPDRSPYDVGLSEIVESFATSQERAEILAGFLDYREALHNAGIAQGFQWLDGSFVENIEDTDGRPPNDIDIVTFFELPQGHSQQSFLTSHGDLFNPTLTKQSFKVDAYPFVLNQQMTERMVRQTAYWYSMWSHRRDGVWKGFAQVSLNSAGDGACRILLGQKVANGFAP